MSEEQDTQRGPGGESAARWFVEIDAESHDYDDESFGNWLAREDNEAALARCELAAHLVSRLQRETELRWAFDEAALLAVGRGPREHQRAWPRNVVIAWGTAALAVVAATLAILTRPAPESPAEILVDGAAGSKLSIAPAPGDSSVSVAAARLRLASEPNPLTPVVELPGRIAVDARSVAVMPFAVSEAGSEAAPVRLEDLAEALHGQVVRQLSSIPGFYAIDRESVLPYAGAPLVPAEIASQLGVRGVVLGNIRMQPEGLRVDLELIDAASGEQLLQGEYDEDSNLETMRDSIAIDIASALADPSKVPAPPNR